jgi:hypothetical protein
LNDDERVKKMMAQPKYTVVGDMKLWDVTEQFRAAASGMLFFLDFERNFLLRSFLYEIFLKNYGGLCCALVFSFPYFATSNLVNSASCGHTRQG